MNILITGGTGFIGSALNRELRNLGHNVIITTRQQTNVEEKVTWNPPELIPQDIISNIDAVINLAGESVFTGRWTDKRKEKIRSSRVTTTYALVQSIKNAAIWPKVLISASAIGYYGDHGDEYIKEDTPAGTDFLARVCIEWEAEALKAEELGIRVVITRFGLVLASGGGALAKMVTPFKIFLGGYIGSGKQWISWIHMNDVTSFIKFALNNEFISGPFNLTAPQPVINKEFNSVLGEILNRPSWVPVPGFVLKIVLGEFGGILLTGQRVIPENALKAGYKFKYTNVNEALKEIFSKK